MTGHTDISHSVCSEVSTGIELGFETGVEVGVEIGVQPGATVGARSGVGIGSAGPSAASLPRLPGLPAPERLGDEDGAPGGSDEGGIALEESKPELKRPPLFKVVLLNDDYTPMEFVVEVLELFFKMNREQATQIMLTVHTQGRGVCGIYTRDIAETKAAQVNQYARDHQHPLLCEIEAAED